MKPMIVVHDDPTFLQAIRLWMQHDGGGANFNHCTERRALEDPGVLADRTKVVLVKCHRLWSQLPERAIVIHDGDLSKFRGCSPMRHAIAAGERQIVVTAFRPTPTVDYGFIVAEQVFNIPEHWEPFCVAWHRAARAYGKIIARLAADNNLHGVAPPPRMGQVYRKWGGRMTQEYLSARQGTDTIYWGLRACGPVYNCGDYGKLDGKPVRWAELSGAAESYGMQPGEHRVEMHNILRFACADWRTILVEVE